MTMLAAGALFGVVVILMLALAIVAIVALIRLK